MYLWFRVRIYDTEAMANSGPFDTICFSINDDGHGNLYLKSRIQEYVLKRYGRAARPQTTLVGKSFTSVTRPSVLIDVTYIPNLTNSLVEQSIKVSMKPKINTTPLPKTRDGLYDGKSHC